MDARGRGRPDRIRGGTTTAAFAAGLALAALVGMPFPETGDRLIAGGRGGATTEAPDRLGPADGGRAHARSAVGRAGLAAATPDADGWVRLSDGLPDYAPAGMPDFDQRQTTWRVPAPDGDKWTHDGPVAAANALWWLDALR